MCAMSEPTPPTGPDDPFGPQGGTSLLERTETTEQVEPGEAERFLCIGAAGYRPGGLILAPGERMRLSLAAGLQ